MLIVELSGDGVNVISKLQYHCANITFDEKSRYDRLFHQVSYKGGESAMNYIKIFKNSQALLVSVGNSYSGDYLVYILLENFH